MTITEIIEKAKDKVPTILNDKVLMEYINELEHKFYMDVLKQEEDIPIYTEYDDTPSINPPYNKCYYLYVAAMIAFDQQEYDIYNNIMIMFNNEWESCKEYYIRNSNRFSGIKFTNLW